MTIYKTTYCLTQQLQKFQQHITHHTQQHKEPITLYRFCAVDNHQQPIISPENLDSTMHQDLRENINTTDLTPYLFVLREAIDKLYPNLKVCLNTQPLVTLHQYSSTSCELEIKIYSFAYLKDATLANNHPTGCVDAQSLHSLTEQEYLTAQHKLNQINLKTNENKQLQLGDKLTLAPWLCVQAQLSLKQLLPAQITKIWAYTAESVFSKYHEQHPDFITLKSTNKQIETTTPPQKTQRTQTPKIDKALPTSHAQKTIPYQEIVKLSSPRAIYSPATTMALPTTLHSFSYLYKAYQYVQATYRWLSWLTSTSWSHFIIKNWLPKLIYRTTNQPTHIQQPHYSTYNPSINTSLENPYASSQNKPN